MRHRTISQFTPKSGLSHLSLALSLGLILSGPAHCLPVNHNPTLNAGGDATDGPAKPSAWSNSAKQGIGASYEAYDHLRYANTSKTGTVSKVWFSLAQGIVTETMYGRIDQAQIRELQLVITGPDYTAFEARDTISHVDYIDKDEAGRPLSPAYRLTNTDKAGRFVIIKDIFTDPDHQSLMMRVTIKPLKGPVTAYVLLDPSMANTSGNDQGVTSDKALSAFEGHVALSLMASTPFVKTNIGFTGVSDGISELDSTHNLTLEQDSTQGTAGNIVMLGQLPKISHETTIDFALGFGSNVKLAANEASATLKSGYKTVLNRFNGGHGYMGWEDYVNSLSELKSLIPYSEDNGKLLYASAITLKVQEDRTHAGAMIASLSNPWGDSVFTKQSSTGYKAVWPRDFYQVSMALAAVGDHETPVAAFRYLPTVQVTAHTIGNKGDGGWFLQKSHIDGTPEWVGVQLDQTAMPILLGWQLQKHGFITEAELKAAYKTSLKPAADFLSMGGTVDIGWNHTKIVPPYSQQERWEEQEGYSPSTTAAVISGLEAASDLAMRFDDKTGASLYSAKAYEYSQKLEPRLYTTQGMVSGKPQSYYLRISKTQDANSPGVEAERNGQSPLASDLMMDAGFIELVRYGIRRADDPHITSSIAAIDNQSLSDDLRVRYDLTLDGHSYPGFRRYGHDGYGDTTQGQNYGSMSPDQRGRVWPIFTGERGHYELALAGLKSGGATKADIDHIRDTYVKAIEVFANEGLMIPEQVFDGIGSEGIHTYSLGKGTDSATPLAWSHAEYIKLLRSLRDRQIWDQNSVAFAHFAAQ